MGNALGLILRGLPLRTGRARGPVLLSRAVFATKAKGSAGVLTDIGTGAHAIQHGSGAGADGNDPLWLPYGGLQGLYLPGTTGNYASAPDSAALSITSDFTADIYLQATDYTPSADCYLISKTNGGGTGGYFIRLKTDGTLQFAYGNGAGFTVIPAPAVSLTDGASVWLRFSYDQNNGAAGQDIRLYTSTDGAAWTQQGSVSTNASTAAMIDTADALNIGIFSDGTSGPYTGKLFRVKIYNSDLRTAAGTPVFDADFSDPAVVAEPYATFAEKSTNAATVTINRSSSGRKAEIVPRDSYDLATDDDFLIADANDLDFDIADSFTVLARVRLFGTPAASQAVLAKKANLTTAAGWALYIDSSRRAVGIIADGTNSTTVTSAALSVGVEHNLAFIRDVANDRIYLVVDGVRVTPVTDTTTGSLANAVGMSIGAANAGAANFLDGVWDGASVFRSVLSDAETTQAGAELVGAVNPDLTLPTLSSATIDSTGLNLTLVFSRPITALPPSEWVLSDGKTGQLAVVSGDGSTWRVILTAAVLQGATPTLRYTGSSAVDVNGGHLLAFSGQAITNNSTYAGEAPVLVASGSHLTSQNLALTAVAGVAAGTVAHAQVTSAGGYTPTTVTDSRGNTWTLRSHAEDSSGYHAFFTCVVGVGKDIIAGDTITCNRDAGGGEILAVVLGITGRTVFDVGSLSATAGTPPAFAAGPTASTATAFETIIGAGFIDAGGGTTATATGYTHLVTLTLNGRVLSVLYKLVSATGAQSISGSITGNVGGINAGGSVAAFK